MATYINTLYEQSSAYHCVMDATKSQLRRRRRYTLMAITYHKEESKEPKQVEFFEAELALIDKRLSLKSTPE